MAILSLSSRINLILQGKGEERASRVFRGSSLTLNTYLVLTFRKQQVGLLAPDFYPGRSTVPGESDLLELAHFYQAAVRSW